MRQIIFKNMFYYEVMYLGLLAPLPLLIFPTISKEWA